MKRINLLLTILCLFSINVSGQYAYAPDYGNGELYRVDLSNPTNKKLIGTTITSIGGADFGQGNVLFAITSGSNMFYSIDTSNASTTLIGNSIPVSGHMWTGLAYDPSTDILFASSTTGNTESAIYTIDISTGAATHIGSTNVAESVVDISFDPIGMLYAYDLSNNIYLIDKSSGTAALLGAAGTHGGLQWHGMGYNYFYDEMYISTYNSLTWDITLRSVDLTTGSTTIIGSLGIAAGDLAMVHPGLSHPIIGFNNDSILFDTTLVNNSSQKSLVVYNYGGDTLKVTDIISFDTIFSVGITSFEVLPGDSQLVQISFAPATAKFYSTYINVLSNDPFVGTYSIYLSGTGETATGIIEEEKSTHISIFPNPFSDQTTISYTLQKPSTVHITIFDIVGREVNTLINTSQDYGTHSIVWDGRNSERRKLKPGVYVYQIEINGHSNTGRITITE